MGFSTTASSIVLAAVSFIEPTAQVSNVDVQARASYSQPCVRASYLQIHVCAQVTMPDVLAVDVITPADQIYLDVSKPVSDIINQPVDSTVLSTEKNFAESLATADSIHTMLIYIRTFADDIYSTDSKAYDLTKALSNAVVIGEDSVYDMSKPLAETLTLTDNMDANIQYQIIKTFSDYTVNTDAQVIDFAPNKSDNVSTSSSGYLLMQDYCDITYFLEDYVGSYRTFT